MRTPPKNGRTTLIGDGISPHRKACITKCIHQSKVHQVSYNDICTTKITSFFAPAGFLLRQSYMMMLASTGLQYISHVEFLFSVDSTQESVQTHFWHNFMGK